MALSQRADVVGRGLGRQQFGARTGLTAREVERDRQLAHMFAACSHKRQAQHRKGSGRTSRFNCCNSSVFAPMLLTSGQWISFPRGCEASSLKVAQLLTLIGRVDAVPAAHVDAHILDAHIVNLRDAP